MADAESPLSPATVAPLPRQGRSASWAIPTTARLAGLSPEAVEAGWQPVTHLSHAIFLLARLCWGLSPHHRGIDVRTSADDCLVASVPCDTPIPNRPIDSLFGILRLIDNRELLRRLAVMVAEKGNMDSFTNTNAPCPVQAITPLLGTPDEMTRSALLALGIAPRKWAWFDADQPAVGVSPAAYRALDFGWRGRGGVLVDPGAGHWSFAPLQSTQDAFAIHLLLRLEVFFYTEVVSASPARRPCDLFIRPFNEDASPDPANINHSATLQAYREAVTLAAASLSAGTKRPAQCAPRRIEASDYLPPRALDA